MRIVSTLFAMARPRDGVCGPLSMFAVVSLSTLGAMAGVLCAPARADGPGDEQVTEWLRRPIVTAERVQAEVEDFTERRVPPPPKATDADAWRAESARIRRDVLDNVVFRGGAAAWRDHQVRVEWDDTVEGLPGYRLKKLRFEMLPGWWIPAVLYEPLKLEGKVPAILNVNGHDGAGKAAPYKQLRCINQAKRGMLALNVEWIGMGQLRGIGHYSMNQLDLCGTAGIAPFYLNMARALDVLLAHPHADPERVAVAGLSGGGWQTIFISSLDTRVKLANPVAGYSSFRTRARHHSDLGDSEQTPNDLAVHADYTHLTALLADRAALLTFNAQDNCCFASDHALQPLMDAAGPLFELLGRRGHLRSHVNHDPGDHNFGLDNRQQLYRMLGDEFFAGAAFDPAEIPSDDEVKSAEELQVPLPDDNLDFNRIARELAKSLPRASDEPAAARRESLRQLVHAPSYQAVARVVGEETRDGVRARFLELRLGDAWTVPAVELTPAEPSGTTLMIADEGRGSRGAEAQALLAEGRRVLAVDPFYFGESTIPSRPFLFGLLVHAVGERCLGIQAAQLAAIGEWSRTEHGAPPELLAVGPRLGVAALVASALDGGAEPQRLGKTTVRDGLASLKDVIEQGWGVDKAPEVMCFGLLEQFDLRQLQELE